LVCEEEGYPCRIYAPVGAHRDLLAYLVRRLLENGANSSFVNQLLDQDVPATQVVSDPLDQMLEVAQTPSHPNIALPPDLYQPQRRNSVGLDLEDRFAVAGLEEAMSASVDRLWKFSHNAMADLNGTVREVRNPARPEEQVGDLKEASVEDIGPAIHKARTALGDWQALPAETRAAVLNKTADLYETHFAELMTLAGREAGKTLLDGVAEIREAVDFLRYYASQATTLSAESTPRGVFACVSPWNFPLAIFTGQISAALAAGNCVIAKPAEQTPLIALRAVALMHQAGVPGDVLQCLPGPGETVGAALTASPGIDGVCFTGSTDTARAIHRSMAQNGNPAAPLIAETGGINAMLVDSTALPEQVVRDVLVSAFQSAGQRCSALRILYLQEDIKERVLTLLFGAMDELELGDPLDPATDVGPVIDGSALKEIRDYCGHQEAAGRLRKQLDAPGDGHFVGPAVIEVEGIADVQREIFGPVLHVAPFAAGEIERVLNDINRHGYGLTLGLHTRVDARVQQVVDLAHVGNIYVNRNQIGAVVGTQPFGGEGLSGTGPKAGGPLYLNRFCTGPLPAGLGGNHRASGADTIIDLAEQKEGFFDKAAPFEAIDPERVRAALERFSSWLPDSVSRAIREFSALPSQMPGPTGESNHWIVYPRGNVLCLGPHPEQLKIQVCQALALGNRVLAVGAEIPEFWTIAADWPLQNRVGKLDPAALNTISGLSAVC
ncbi:MAG: bifunctional proline dehydrogenase/L-glutamate gamma-semialdehyde dehydrogenase PutA, partial [Pseudomonadota bacterium]|nr:bifunctional proline dehydrogenase/L-glutamate gamma-semialdehyde dehydrogenase PutA [Pseudomonadota bacterium]